MNHQAETDNGSELPAVPALPAEKRDGGFFRILWRQRRIALSLFLLSVATGCLYVTLRRPTYISSSRLMIQPTGAALVDPDASRTFLNSQCELIKSMPVIAVALGSAGVDENVDAVRNAMSVDIDNKTRAVTVSVESPSAVEAANLVNEIVKAYMDFQSARESAAAESALSAMVQQKQQQDEKLQSATQRMAAVRGAEGATTAAAPATTEMVADPVSLEAAKAEAVVAQGIYEDAAGLAPGTANIAAAGPGDGNAVLSTEEIEGIRSELVDLRRRLREMQGLYLPSHPLVKATQSRIDALTEQYVAAARNRWVSAAHREMSMRKDYEAHRSQALRMQSQAAELKQLQEEVARLQKASDDAETKISQVDLSRDAAPVLVVQLERAKPAAAAVHPNKPLVLELSAIIGLVLGCGAAIGREKLDPRFHSAESVKLALGLPVLGSIPTMAGVLTPTARGQKVSLDPTSEVAEAFRSIRTALQFAPSGRKFKSIVVTSPAADDGKTTLISNLGIALAQGGKRVVLLDADLRNPTLHQVFATNGKVGLTNVLSGGAVSEVIQRSPVPNLDIIPSGPPPADAYESLNAATFTELLDELSDRYDHILIDAPPVLANNDARVIAAQTDGTLLVMRIKKSDRKTARAAAEAITSVGGTIIGLAVNDVMPKAAPAYGSPPRRPGIEQPSPRGLTMQEMGALKRLKTNPRAGRSS